MTHTNHHHQHQHHSNQSHPLRGPSPPLSLPPHNNNNTSPPPIVPTTTTDSSTNDTFMSQYMGMPEPLRQTMQRMIQMDSPLEQWDAADGTGVRLPARQFDSDTRAFPRIPGPLPPPFLFSGGEIPDGSSRYRSPPSVYPERQPSPQQYQYQPPPRMYRTDERGRYNDDPMRNMSYEDVLQLQERVGSVSRGVDQDTIEKTTMSQKITSQDEIPTDTNCTICMDCFEEGQEFRRLPCVHFFHKECIDQWLKNSGSCPICKKSIKDSVSKEDTK